MSVGVKLGLDGLESELLQRAAEAWTAWAGQYPELQKVPDLASLRGWIRDAEYADRERVLRALGRLGSVRGDDVAPAAAALIWVLLPGASLLASRLRTLSPAIDELVASQLWLEVRGLRWESTWKVAATVLMNTRRGVLCDIGMFGHTDPTWDCCTVVDPTATSWLDVIDDGSDAHPATELALLLERARRDRVITDDQRALLFRLAELADDGSRPRCGAKAGLASDAATSVVAAELGASPRTVRRYAQRTVGALSRHYARTAVPA